MGSPVPRRACFDFLPLTGPAARSLLDRMLERAIGVIYRPDTERVSRYFHATLAALAPSRGCGNLSLWAVKLGTL